MGPASLERMTELAAREWRLAIRRWERGGPIVLLEESQRLLTRATCAWAGVPLDEADVSRRARDFAFMIDAFGGAGPRLWKGKLARSRAESWLTKIIEGVRDGSVRATPGSALHVMAHHREVDGEPLPARTAAVELINVIRPTVAVSWLITFAALALFEHPEMRERVANDERYADLFVQEVRRFYPFTPYLGAKVRAPFEWKGHRFAKGTLVLLDVYGNDHDPGIWGDGETFRPERFESWSGGAYDFIPQGGGTRMGHRCPGEWVVMHHLALALHYLARCTTYDVPADQDLRVDLGRMPARPASGFVMRDVRATPLVEADPPRRPSATAARDSAAAEAAGELTSPRARPAPAATPVSGVEPAPRSL